MKSMNVKVSIIILNYNGKKFLQKLFHTLEKQTYKDFEVIFVDNASNDESLKELEEILSRKNVNFDVKVVRNSKNFGYCKGNNIGLMYASGEYIVFLNNDTFLASTWLEELVKVLEENPKIGACQSRLILAGTSIVRSDGFILDIYGWTQRFIRNKKNTTPKAPFYLAGASLIVRKTVLNHVGSFDPKLFFGDYDLSWRIKLAGYQLESCVNSICYHYGRHATKILFKDFMEAFHNFKEIIRVFIKNYSLKSLVKRLPPAIMVMLISATYSSLKHKNPIYLGMLVKAIALNLKNLKNTLLRRRRIQFLRKLDDKEIEKKMSSYPVLLSRTP